MSKKYETFDRSPDCELSYTYRKVDGVWQWNKGCGWEDVRYYVGGPSMLESHVLDGTLIPTRFFRIPGLTGPGCGYDPVIDHYRFVGNTGVFVHVDGTEGEAVLSHKEPPKSWVELFPESSAALLASRKTTEPVKAAKTYEEGFKDGAAYAHARGREYVTCFVDGLKDNLKDATEFAKRANETLSKYDNEDGGDGPRDHDTDCTSAHAA